MRLPVALIALLAWALALAPAAFPRAQAGAGDEQDPTQVAVRVDPPEGEVGMLFDIEVSVSGAAAADCALLDVPRVDGGRLERTAGPNTSQSRYIVNGRVTSSIRTSWQFRFVAERPGTISIPPFRLNCRGAESLSKPITIAVAPSSLPAGAVTLEVRAGADELWAGQTFAIDVKATIEESLSERVLNNGLELDLPWATAGVTGMLALETPAPAGQTAALRLVGGQAPLEMRYTRDTSGGAPRLVLARTFLVMATRPGELRLPASRFSAVIATRTRRERDPFSLFGGERLVATSSAVVDARAPEVALTVREPPEAGRPPGYTNAVGRFRLTASAAPTTLKVGETCTLSLSLAGSGNLDFVEWPAFDELKQDFRIFGKKDTPLDGARLLELQVSPKTERVAAIPALSFAAFDPERGAYDVLSVGPFALDVTPGGADGLVTLESPSDTLTSLETIREDLPAPSGGTLPGWLAVLPGVAALGWAEWTRRRRDWRARHGDLLRRREARARLEASLETAGDLRDVTVAFGKFLSDRLAGPPAGLSAAEARPLLARVAAGRGAPAREPAGELEQALQQAWDGWEAAFLGGRAAGPVPSVGAAREQARALAARVEAAT